MEIGARHFDADSLIAFLHSGQHGGACPGKGVKDASARLADLHHIPHKLQGLFGNMDAVLGIRVTEHARQTPNISLKRHFAVGPPHDVLRLLAEASFLWTAGDFIPHGYTAPGPARPLQGQRHGRKLPPIDEQADGRTGLGNAAGILTVLYASLLALPVPFAAVHLLFINLLTDSLPAIALGLEPHSDAVMREKPRQRSEGILTRPFLISVAVDGVIIAAATILAFHLGLSAGGAAVGSTMAFATLCLSRLFHGFSCKSGRPVLFTRAFWNNRFLLGAFVLGAVLLTAVLTVPVLEPLFQVAPLTMGQLGTVAGLSLGSMVLIQLRKLIRKG